MSGIVPGISPELIVLYERASAKHRRAPYPVFSVTMVHETVSIVFIYAFVVCMRYAAAAGAVTGVTSAWNAAIRQAARYV